MLSHHQWTALLSILITLWCLTNLIVLLVSGYIYETASGQFKLIQGQECLLALGKVSVGMTGLTLVALFWPAHAPNHPPSK